MKRTLTVIAALGLIAGACGSSDGDTPAAEDTATTVAASNDDGADDAASEPAADDPTADDAMADDAMADDGTADDGSGNDGGGATIRSINDIPKPCREAMADFLREIEPVVSGIDWENATMADFEDIGTEFQALSDDFDARSASEGCDDLNFENDDTSFDLVIEFAKDEAPGTVAFFEFLQSFIGDSSIGSVDPVDDSASGAEISTCEDALAFMQNLIGSYDSVAEVPMSELLKFTDISTTAYTTCTPAQLEFFDSDEFTAFFDQ